VKLEIHACRDNTHVYVCVCVCDTLLLILVILSEKSEVGAIVNALPEEARVRAESLYVLEILSVAEDFST